MSAVGRLRPAESRQPSDQSELDTFQSERGVAPRASAPPCLFVSVPAYPARESHPTSSARLLPESPAHITGVAVRPRIMTSIGRKVRWIAFAPVRLCAAGFAAIGRGAYAVVSLGRRMVSGAARGVVALVRAMVDGIVGAAVGTARRIVAGLQAVGRGVAAAFTFVVQTVVHAMGAGVAEARRVASRAALAVAALARAVVSGIAGAAVAMARLLVAARPIVERGVAAVFVLVLDRTAHVARAAVAVGVGATAAGRRVIVSGISTLTVGATASVVRVRGEARRIRHATARLATATVGLLGVALTGAASAGRASWNRSARAWRPRELWAAVIAVSLVGAVVTAGGVLQSSRGPVAQPVAAVVRIEAPAQPLLVPVAAAVMPRPEATARVMTQRATRAARPASLAPPAMRRPVARADAGIEAAPRAGLNAETVRAIWRKTDTRSLDRGIAAVRSATLALHRCRVQMTGSDRAVAHCDVLADARHRSAQPRNAAWTIDFRRSDERWLIDDISTAAR